MVKKIFFLCFLVICNYSFSQQNIDPQNAIVSILTVGTADESHSLYGHTALRIKDDLTNTDLVYNYGMFDFATKNFMLKFVKGDLQYYAAAYPYNEFEYNYRVENRSIYEQVLNLSAEQKKSLIAKLETTLQPENRNYTYKFIDRNCTTKVVDILNEVIGQEIIKKQNTETKTYREVLYPYAANHFYQKLGINIIFGEKVDHLATKLFLPLDLYENLKTVNYKNQPLITKTNPVFEAQRPQLVSYLDSIYSFIGILLLIVLFNKKAVYSLFFMLLGAIGCLFSVIGLYSFHKEVLWNYNILLFNPLLLLLLFFVFQKNNKWIQKTAWLCLGLLGIYLIYMLNKVHLVIVLPLIITVAIVLFRLTKYKTESLE
jgi:thiamine pyrophosphokinase